MSNSSIWLYFEYLLSQRFWKKKKKDKFTLFIFFYWIFSCYLTCMARERFLVQIRQGKTVVDRTLATSYSLTERFNNNCAGPSLFNATAGGRATPPRGQRGTRPSRLHKLIIAGNTLQPPSKTEVWDSSCFFFFFFLIIKLWIILLFF